MSLLDNIETKKLLASEEVRQSMVSVNLTDAFNPQRYKYALLIGADEHSNWIPYPTEMQFEQLFSGYGDFRIQWMSVNVSDCEPLVENAKQWGITTYKNDNYIVMFNFRGNQLVQARMIISLCAIVKRCIEHMLLDSQPLIRTYIKCDPTHRGNHDVWWAPRAAVPEALITHIASRTAMADVKTREIEDFASGYFHFGNRDYDYIEKVQKRLERMRPNRVKSWFFDE